MKNPEQLFNRYKSISDDFIWIKIAFEVYSVYIKDKQLEVVARRDKNNEFVSFFIFKSYVLRRVLRSREVGFKKALSLFEKLPEMKSIFSKRISLHADWIETAKKLPETRAQTVELVKHHMHIKHYSKFEASIVLTTYFAIKRERKRELLRMRQLHQEKIRAKHRLSSEENNELPL